jgi:hypothetical protein
MLLESVWRRRRRPQSPQTGRSHRSSHGGMVMKVAHLGYGLGAGDSIALVNRHKADDAW